MNAIQSNKLAMYSAVRVFLTEFLNSTTATSAFPALAVKHAALSTLIDRIVGNAAAQEEPLRGSIEAREGALAEATDATLAIAGPVLSYAQTHRLPELAVQVRLRRSHFHRMRLAERTRLSQRVHDAAAEVVGQLADYGITAAKLAELQAKIDATDVAVTVTRSTAAGKKVATEQLARLFAETDALLAAIDPLLVPLRLTDQESHAGYMTARQIFERPGVRHTPDTRAMQTPPSVPTAAVNASREKLAA